MNFILVCISLLFCSSVCKSQIKDGGFELANSDSQKEWIFKKKNGYEINMDSLQKKSGEFSLSIIGNPQTEKESQSFFQSIPYHPNNIEKIRISAFVKSENAKGVIQLWTQIRNKNDEMIDFGNSVNQNKRITVNQDWNECFLEFFVDENTEKILVGGFFDGSGDAWFDDFEVRKIQFSNEPASEIAEKYITDFKTIIRKNSLFTNKINWEKTEQVLSNISKGMKTIEDTEPAIQYLLRVLKKSGDNHSFIESKDHFASRKISNTKNTEPKHELLNSHVGYVMVPGFNSSNTEVGNRFSEDILNGIIKLDRENKIKGWIVDLRQNTGGNMYPMLFGLQSLTGTGILGYFVKNDGTKVPWKFKKGKVGKYTLSKTYDLKKTKSKIAILIGSKTASAGEATAIPFIGKKNVKLFGQPSRGLTTGNRVYPLADGRALALSSSYEMDRTGKKYDDKIIPDIIVEEDKKSNPDLTIQAAIKWLEEK